MASTAKKPEPKNRRRYLMQALREQLDGFGVGDARERLSHPLERCEVALENREVVPALLQGPLHDVLDEILGEVHVPRQVHVGHLGFDHPELGEVAAGL